MYRADGLFWKYKIADCAKVDEGRWTWQRVSHSPTNAHTHKHTICIHKRTCRKLQHRQPPRYGVFVSSDYVGRAPACITAGHGFQITGGFCLSR